MQFVWSSLDSFGLYTSNAFTFLFQVILWSITMLSVYGWLIRILALKNSFWSLAMPELFIRLGVSRSKFLISI